MHVIGHENESDQPSGLTRQLGIQYPENDPASLIIVQQPSPLVARKGDEVRIQFVVEDVVSCHSGSIDSGLSCDN